MGIIVNARVEAYIELSREAWALVDLRRDAEKIREGERRRDAARQRYVAAVDAERAAAEPEAR